MLALVRIALKRPYTFVVMAMLIVIAGVLSWIRTPTDIFPAIRIPVVAVVWTYNGLPPDDMSGRVVYYYERAVSSTVNDIEHIESQSMSGYGVVKIYFQPTVDISSALAQITAASQTVLKLLPPGITPPYVLSYNASSVPVIQLALSSNSLPEAKIFDFGQNMIRPQLATVAGAAVPSPYGGMVRQVQIDVDQAKLRSYGLSAEDIVSAVGNQDLIIPVGTQKIADKEYVIKLNDSPETIEALNDLPVRTVDGVTVRIGDVAFVHDSHPPQINMVRVNGDNAVLMSIIKAGSASTLDVIEGVKALVPSLREMLPESLKLVTVGDQAPFVQGAVNSVLFEGGLAAALTGLMILIFLGSWRSTVIIIISIPLAILTSIAALAATGENINVMTLGGLALAVGILVDDATVTIENINFQLEQKKEIEAAIMDGARQIVIPATVSLLCICIVFVPMFSLGGISGYLFRPMAKAVVFALMGSYLLSRTLVPTMANYLLAGHAHDPDQPPRGFFGRFQHGFEQRFAAARRGYAGMLTAATHRRRGFIPLFLVFVLLSLGLVPFLGQNFFPTVETVQLKLHVRGPTGLRIEETGRLFTRVETAINTIAGPGVVASMVDNIGLPISGINAAYGNSGTIGSADGDILITLEEGQEKNNARSGSQIAGKIAGTVPQRDLFLPPRGHRDPNSQFRPAGADRRAGDRKRFRRKPVACEQAVEADLRGDRRRRRAHPATGGPADDQRGRQPHSRQPPRRYRTGHRHVPAHHSGRFDPDQSGVLAEPEKRRVLSGGDPDAAILDEIAGGSRARPGLAGQIAANPRRGRGYRQDPEQRRGVPLFGPAGDRYFRHQQRPRPGLGLGRHPQGHPGIRQCAAARNPDRASRTVRDDEFGLFPTLRGIGLGDCA